MIHVQLLLVKRAMDASDLLVVALYGFRLLLDRRRAVYHYFHSSCGRSLTANFCGSGTYKIGFIKRTSTCLLVACDAFPVTFDLDPPGPCVSVVADIISVLRGDGLDI